MFTPETICEAISIVIRGLTAIVPDLADIAPKSVLDNVEKCLADAASVNTALVAADARATAEPLVVRIIADFSATATACEALPLPPRIALPLRILTLLMPVLETAARFIWP